MKDNRMLMVVVFSWHLVVGIKILFTCKEEGRSDLLGDPLLPNQQGNIRPKLGGNHIILECVAYLINHVKNGILVPLDLQIPAITTSCHKEFNILRRLCSIARK
eukprot:CAMPEP_0171297924 /NCGR_PEP_ID=MMETSP0816-20121228/6680_1 /TAXON_ID=420281 /ORGANISM="Proboscia inermis, Strain CCAP1064/1" /LENGTH=103 /DNA_ID=CAMNT_0011772577 /DNA_START=218 /DNA_END=529 /DNA_ORIENTATION=-